MNPRLYVQARQKPMLNVSVFHVGDVLSKDTRTAVCWAFCCFPFTFASIWSPGESWNCRAAYAVLTRVRSIFRLKLLGFDSDTRHFIRLWIIFTKAGLCFACLVPLWDSCVIFFFFLKNTIERHPLCFQFGAHQWGEKYGVSVMSISVEGTTVHFDVMFLPFL